MTTPMPLKQSIECHCGFIVQGPDSAANFDAFTEHSCCDEEVPTRWYQAVFSFWGVMIAIFVTIAVTQIAAGKGWFE